MRSSASLRRQSVAGHRSIALGQRHSRRGAIIPLD
jgi:hypothetical protein